MYSVQTIKEVLEMINTRGDNEPECEFTVEVGKHENTAAVGVQHKQVRGNMRIEQTCTGFTVEVLHGGVADFLGDVQSDEIESVFSRFVGQVKEGQTDAITKPVRDAVIRIHDHLQAQIAGGRTFDDVEVEFENNYQTDELTLKVKRGAVNVHIQVSDIIAIRFGGRLIDQMTILDASDFKKNNAINVFNMAVHNISSKQAPLFVSRGGVERRLWSERPVTTEQLIDSVYGV